MWVRYLISSNGKRLEFWNENSELGRACSETDEEGGQELVEKIAMKKAF